MDELLGKIRDKNIVNLKKIGSLKNQLEDEKNLVKRIIDELSKQGKIESMDYGSDSDFPIERNIADLILILNKYGYKVDLDA